MKARKVICKFVLKSHIIYAWFGNTFVFAALIGKLKLKSKFAKDNIIWFPKRFKYVKNSFEQFVKRRFYEK